MLKNLFKDDNTMNPSWNLVRCQKEFSAEMAHEMLYDGPNPEEENTFLNFLSKIKNKYKNVYEKYKGCEVFPHKKEGKIEAEFPKPKRMRHKASDITPVPKKKKPVVYGTVEEDDMEESEDISFVIDAEPQRSGQRRPQVLSQQVPHSFDPVETHPMYETKSLLDER